MTEKLARESSRRRWLVVTARVATVLASSIVVASLFALEGEAEITRQTESKRAEQALSAGFGDGQPCGTGRSRRSSSCAPGWGEHDMFAVPFDEIAPIIDRSPEAARQLASRARRRVQGEKPLPDADLGTQRKVVDAFLAAAREGDFEALLEVLDPDVVLRRDVAPLGGSGEVRGARMVAGQALAYSRSGLLMQPALINGAVGVVAILDGEPYSVGAFTVRGGRIAEIDILADPERLSRLDLTTLGN